MWFDAGAALPPYKGVRLDLRTRLLYDERHLFINGESCRIGGRDARLLRRLADQGRLQAREVAMLSAEASAEL